MKKFLTVIFVTLLVVFIGFKSFVFYQVSQAMQALKQALQHEAVVEYGWISSSLDGEIRVQNLRITPFQLKDTIAIDAVALKVPGTLELLKLSDKLANKQAPEALEWRIEGLRLSLASSAFDTDIRQGVLDHALETVACGDIKVMGPSQWRSMGYQNLVMSATGGYRHDGIQQTLNFYGSLVAEAMGSMTLDISLKLPEGLQGISPAEFAKNPQIDHIKIGIKDDSYLRRVSHFCTRYASLEQAQYMDQSVQDWTQAMAKLGIGVNADLQKAYRYWLEGDRQLLVELHPQRNLDYKLLPFIKPKDALELLGASIKVDDYSVKDFAISFDDKQFTASQQPKQPPPVEVQLPKKATPPPAPTLSYKTTDVAELNNYTNAQVRITTQAGKVYEGKLVEIGEYGLQVSTNVAGGSVTYPVRLTDVVEAEVYR